MYILFANELLSFPMKITCVLLIVSDVGNKPAGLDSNVKKKNDAVDLDSIFLLFTNCSLHTF